VLVTMAGSVMPITTLGSRVTTHHLAQKVPLELAGQVFSIHLITLKGQGIDVIIGMSWIKIHTALLDISSRLVQLDSPIYGKIT
jgi:nicotinate-nucleotide pyrophosphorylase